MSFETFEIGGVEIPVYAVASFQQTYSTLGGAFLSRMMDGTAKKQTNWDKIATELSGSGTMPIPLLNLDYTQPMTLKCASKRAVASGTVTVPLPITRRADIPHEPLGFAMLADRSLVATSINIISDVATLGVIGGAVQYIVHYWPELTVYAFEPQENIDQLGKVFGWSLSAEEV